MKIAIEGCCHGELDAIYSSLAQIEEVHKIKVDLLICCGDFQCVRDSNDLQYLACPPKYRDLRDFPAYFRGEKEAPCLTVFVGGNHEAPSVLRELYYGGWVAPKIFYLGHAGVINVGGVRIAGLSGIYKPKDFRKGYFEKPPYDEDTMRSAYHVREFEIAKLSELSGPVDVVATHDWPEGIYEFGDKAELLRCKPYLEKDIRDHELGNPHTMELLKKLKPAFWFAAHLHARFAAVYVHPGPEGKATRFLALDKVLPRRDFLQILDVDPRLPAGYVQELSPERVPRHSPPAICYDEEWLAILRANQRAIPLGRALQKSSAAKGPSHEDLAAVKRNLDAADLPRRRLPRRPALRLETHAGDTATESGLGKSGRGATAGSATAAARGERCGEERSHGAPGREGGETETGAPESTRSGDTAGERKSGGEDAHEEWGFEWPNWEDPRAPYRDLKRQRLFLLKVLGYGEVDDKFGDGLEPAVEDIDISVDWSPANHAPPKTEEVDICLDISDEETS
ncbi:hypothetical protein NCLIV_015600 [Neospora caninum Liverpool]|uniref:Lariat debranching enzyme A n=1 Tax=Neospora caninum (strain Liverpool) TaxID=572307 RepID=F0VDH5_NEOCL|nr:hypothetical protein NCLIV_015600 [Neospora caninum Liverpool]CBZ51768.1 hypothetical protein NCLIV_015600 [Neospora caninum Liverpool]CEL65725.1 TPA: Lariat debranching enzyme A [Neospora caninum Liverpool]|eukprot:XP_003881801.1 hypothetical protein NCLIV_015600 [Neospora caninum Liverpool]